MLFSNILIISSDASSMSTFNLAAPDPPPSSSEESVSIAFSNNSGKNMKSVFLYFKRQKRE